VKITFTAKDCVPKETLERNRAHSLSLGLPMLGHARAPYLAVVGGGPSVADHIEELSGFPVIWAINGTFKWLRDRGVLSQFFTLDPKPGIADLCRYADSAVMSVQCDPAAFAAMPGAYVELVDVTALPAVGPTTASTAPLIAAQCGFKTVSFFGCEGSFGAETHAYGTPRDVNLLRVVCNGQEFMTSPQMLQQAEYLAEIIRGAPQFCIDRSGGLLSACVADPEIDVIAASRSIYDAAMRAA
jgi:hypothetical protein